MRNLCACGRAIVAEMIACVAPGARPDRDTEAQRFPCARRIGSPERPYIILQLRWRPPARQRRRCRLPMGTGKGSWRNLCACGRATGAQMTACVAPGARPDRDTEAQRFPCPRRIGPPERPYIILQLRWRPPARQRRRCRLPLGTGKGSWRSLRATAAQMTACVAPGARHRGAEVSLRSEDFPV